MSVRRYHHLPPSILVFPICCLFCLFCLFLLEYSPVGVGQVIKVEPLRNSRAVVTSVVLVAIVTLLLLGIHVTLWGTQAGLQRVRAGTVRA